MMVWILPRLLKQGIWKKKRPHAISNGYDTLEPIS